MTPPGLDCDDFRDIVDWGYYKERLGRSIQRTVTIPAGLQNMASPCPRAEHPVWVKRLLQDELSGQKQMKLSKWIVKKDYLNATPTATASKSVPLELLPANELDDAGKLFINTY